MNTTAAREDDVMGDDLWFATVRMTPERWAVHDQMTIDDEGLGPRAYRCLLQLADREQPIQADVEWLTDGLEKPSIAHWNAWSGVCELTVYGRLLAYAVDRGDAEAVMALTTRPEWLGLEAKA